REEVVFAGHRSIATAVAFSPDGRSLASASDDRTARIWNLGTSQALPEFRLPRSMSVAYSPDGRSMATYDRNEGLTIAETAAKQLLPFPSPSARGPAAVQAGAGSRSLAWSADGSRLVLGLDNSITVRETSAQGRQVQFHGREMFFFTPPPLLDSPLSYLATTSFRIHPGTYHTTPILRVSCSKRARRVASL